MVVSAKRNLTYFLEYLNAKKLFIVLGWWGRGFLFSFWYSHRLATKLLSVAKWGLSPEHLVDVWLFFAPSYGFSLVLILFLYGGFCETNVSHTSLNIILRKNYFIVLGRRGRPFSLSFFGWSVIVFAQSYDFSLVLILFLYGGFCEAGVSHTFLNILMRNNYFIGLGRWAHI